MQVVTITIPDDLADRLHALPAETLNRYAVAALRGIADDADADGLVPVRRGDLPAAHVVAIGAGLADSDAGRVTDGATVLAELRRLTGWE